ncbi:hypothetical protein A2U01_0060051, partial [Trifolium medium]|nr:hypothetical protein [Trifolium medium]
WGWNGHVALMEEGHEGFEKLLDIGEVGYGFLGVRYGKWSLV